MIKTIVDVEKCNRLLKRLSNARGTITDALDSKYKNENLVRHIQNNNSNKITTTTQSETSALFLLSYLSFDR